jgi:NADH-quinone oxidoreductase subunit F
MMGSGGMIVMDNRDLRGRCGPLFPPILEEESCGKCLPCRLGLKGMIEFLDRFANGQGRPEDIDDLQAWPRPFRTAPLCALGGSSPNPVLTTIRYFRDEYEAHILGHKCRPGSARA